MSVAQVLILLGGVWAGLITWLVLNGIMLGKQGRIVPPFIPPDRAANPAGGVNASPTAPRRAVGLAPLVQSQHTDVQPSGQARFDSGAIAISASPPEAEAS